MTAVTGQSVAEQLMTHIEALIVEHDRRDAVELVQRVVRSQITINTAGEQERAALWAFVRADDEELAALMAYGALDADSPRELTSRARRRLMDAQQAQREAREALHGYEDAGRE